VILVDGKVVGSALSLNVDESLMIKTIIIQTLLENTFSTHNQKAIFYTE
jgi:hypothetical protein